MLRKAQRRLARIVSREQKRDHSAQRKYRDQRFDTIQQRHSVFIWHPAGQRGGNRKRVRGCRRQLRERPCRKFFFRLSSLLGFGDLVRRGRTSAAKRHADADRDGRPDADRHRNRDADSHRDRNRICDADSHRHRNRNRDADSDHDGHRDAYSDCDPDPHTGADGYSITDRDPDRDSHDNAYRDAEANPNPGCYRRVDADGPELWKTCGGDDQRGQNGNADQ